MIKRDQSAASTTCADEVSACAKTRRRLGSTLAAVPLIIAFSTASSAQQQQNSGAVFAALDKVTARISTLEVKLGETKRFGALKVTPRACYSRPPTEPPKTSTFVEVDEIMLDGKEKRIFSGWMFAESPGLNAVEHPVYDVWLTACQQGGPTTAQAAGKDPGGPAAATGDAAQDAARRPRPRR